jgi:hypothetical protein
VLFRRAFGRGAPIMKKGYVDRLEFILQSDGVRAHRVRKIYEVERRGDKTPSNLGEESWSPNRCEPSQSSYKIEDAASIIGVKIKSPEPFQVSAEGTYREILNQICGMVGCGYFWDCFGKGLKIYTPSVATSPHVSSGCNTYSYLKGWTDQESASASSWIFQAQKNYGGSQYDGEVITYETIKLSPSRHFNNKSDEDVVDGILGGAYKRYLAITNQDYEALGYVRVPNYDVDMSQLRALLEKPSDKDLKSNDPKVIIRRENQNIINRLVYDFLGGFDKGEDGGKRSTDEILKKKLGFTDLTDRPLPVTMICVKPIDQRDKFGIPLPKSEREIEREMEEQSGTEEKTIWFYDSDMSPSQITYGDNYFSVNQEVSYNPPPQYLGDTTRYNNLDNSLFVGGEKDKVSTSLFGYSIDSRPYFHGKSVPDIESEKAALKYAISASMHETEISFNIGDIRYFLDVILPKIVNKTSAEISTNNEDDEKANDKPLEQIISEVKILLNKDYQDPKYRNFIKGIERDGMKWIALYPPRQAITYTKSEEPNVNYEGELSNYTSIQEDIAKSSTTIVRNIDVKSICESVLDTEEMVKAEQEAEDDFESASSGEAPSSNRRRKVFNGHLFDAAGLNSLTSITYTITCGVGAIKVSARPITTLTVLKTTSKKYYLRVPNGEPKYSHSKAGDISSDAISHSVQITDITEPMNGDVSQLDGIPTPSEVKSKRLNYSEIECDGFYYPFNGSLRSLSASYTNSAGLRVKYVYKDPPERPVYTFQKQLGKR